MFSYIFKSFSTSTNIILLGCDGLGETYLDTYLYNLPNISYLILNGSRTHHARCRQPSVSAPNWSSILTGMSPEETGITNNDWTPEDTNPITYGQLELPPISGIAKIPETIWQIIKTQNNNLSTSAIFSWSWIKYLTNSSVDVIIDTKENDTYAKQSVLDMIKSKELSNFLFIHLNDIDSAGHQYGWGSRQYFDAISSIDKFIGDLLQYIKDYGYNNNTIIILTSDHGGWQHKHNYFNQDSFYIPIIFYGFNIKKNYTIPYYVNNLMIAPTILHLLGLKEGLYMSSTYIKNITTY